MYFIHYNWFTSAKEVGLSEVAGVELTFSKLVLLSTPSVIFTFIGIFILVYRFEDLKDNLSDNQIIIPPMVMSVDIFLQGILGCRYIPLAFNWWNFIATTIFTGICSGSYFFHFYFQRIKRKLEFIAQYVGNADLFAKRIELEHKSLQENFHILAYFILIFITGVVASSFISPFWTSVPPKVLSTCIHDTEFMVIYYLVGILFGIFRPILKYMNYLHLLLEKLSI
jgi:hypothetical protein